MQVGVRNEVELVIYFFIHSLLSVMSPPSPCCSVICVSPVVDLVTGWASSPNNSDIIVQNGQQKLQVK